ncbi:hypothetical protein GQ600_19406 [Phytophthora cactorum]|nr:hypothetical protein GQ600_19406 [Phytophthora cactorum]
MTEIVEEREAGSKIRTPTVSCPVGDPQLRGATRKPTFWTDELQEGHLCDPQGEFYLDEACVALSTPSE